MNVLLTFLVRWEIPIYLIATIMLMVGIGRFIQSRYRLNRAVYTLEREAGTEIRNNALTLLVVSLGILGGMYYFNQTAAPAIRESLVFVPTIDPFETPFASPSPLPLETATIDRIYVTPNLVATATLSSDSNSANADGNEVLSGGDPAETPLPRPPTRPPVEIFIPDQGGCNPSIAISSPRPGSVLTSTIDFYGTATDQRFGFYGLEIYGDGTGEDWISLLDDPVFSAAENEFLGSANLSLLPDGDYAIRLSMFDVTTEVIGRCEIEIAIGPEPDAEATGEPEDPDQN